MKEEEGEEEEEIENKIVSHALIQISVPLLFGMEISYFQKETGKCRGGRK